MTNLILPSRLAPSNLRLKEGTKLRYVDNDLYDIAQRTRAVSEHVYILEADEGDAHGWIIMEDCRDGMQRLIFKTKELDGRVLEKLREIMALDLHERIKAAERMEYKLEQERVETRLEDTYEKMGRDMWTQLEKSGFIQRPVSYPKAGVATRGKKAR